MPRRRPGHLSREDRALWEQVARRTRPLSGRPAGTGPDPASDAAPQTPPRASDPIAPFSIGSRAGQSRTTAGIAIEAADGAPIRMDRKAFARLRGGKLSPEARIDLHGMTLAQAHPALNGFILRAQAEGRRLVLVITGKGLGPDGDGPIPERRGVLKRQVPHWLHQPPLSAAVLQVAEAHRRHGGEGAFYVYLRRAR
ncbi:DNA-nicking Smr family endonuclease [Rhodovulum euryhalinum]|uniref:DNA-nicking Smr family endonuclease n=2 Tax=Rhodovulum euryhalinum TaxID=35805 RepID=A0A4R2KHV3_9RHOB|nr:Smr/MutS family protein [Rhodovulum euryhalinum]TCO73421.1 DNA-nicking Smr family endonuclease [Rhodovulum euryhalinum]